MSSIRLQIFNLVKACSFYHDVLDKPNLKFWLDNIHVELFRFAELFRNWRKLWLKNKPEGNVVKVN